jgi:hypothetical protein
VEHEPLVGVGADMPLDDASYFKKGRVRPVAIPRL